MCYLGTTLIWPGIVIAVKLNNCWWTYNWSFKVDHKLLDPYMTQYTDTQQRYDYCQYHLLILILLYFTCRCCEGDWKTKHILAWQGKRDRKWIQKAVQTTACTKTEKEREEKANVEWGKQRAQLPCVCSHKEIVDQGEPSKPSIHFFPLSFPLFSLFYHSILAWE